MVDRVEWFEVTVPAGTLMTNLFKFPTKFVQGEVVSIDLDVPPGPAGNLGLYIAAGGGQWLPRTLGSFIVPDNFSRQWPQRKAPNSGDYSIVAYNTDVFDHTFWVSYQVNELALTSGLTASTYVSV